MGFRISFFSATTSKLFLYIVFGLSLLSAYLLQKILVLFYAALVHQKVSMG